MAAAAATRPGRVALDVAQRLLDGPVVGIADDRRQTPVTYTEQDRNGLRRGERQVIGQHLARVRGLRGEQRQELLIVDRPAEACSLYAATQPSARRLAAAGVVVLLALGDVVDVVARITGPAADLADGQHVP